MSQPVTFLVTGAAGFIASHLCVKLLEYLKETYSNALNYLVVGIDKEGYCSSARNLETIHTNPHFVYMLADITNLDIMDRLFSRYKFNFVLHLAAETHVDNSFGNSLRFTQSNIYGTHILLEVSKKYRVGRFVHMSTDEVYGDSDLMSSETSSLEPTNPYAATKVAAEYLVKSYHRSFELPVIIVRGNNIYGPGQFPEKMIPRFILRILRGSTCTIHGSGKQRRSWLYVQDAVDALVKIIQHGEIGHIYNIGTEKECDVLSVACHLFRIIKGDTYCCEDDIKFVKDRCFNDKRYLIDSSKLFKLTGWTPATPFEEGLKKTVDWYKSIVPKLWWDATEVEKALS